MFVMENEIFIFFFFLKCLLFSFFGKIYVCRRMHFLGGIDRSFGIVSWP